MLLNFNEYSQINEGKILDFLEFGNAANKRLPKTQDEVNYDNKLSLRAIKLYDDIFGTNFTNKYKDDFSLLVKDPSINKVTSGDIISKLIEMSYIHKVYSKFDIKTSKDGLEELLLKQIMNSYQIKEINTKDILEYLNKLTKKSRVKKFLYDLYLDYGNNFDVELIKEVFEIKRKKSLHHHRDNLIELPTMDKYLETAWWKSIKWSLSHYKDYFETKEMLNKALDKMFSLITKEDMLIFSYIDSKIILFKERLKELSK